MSNTLTPQVITPFNVAGPVYNITGKDLIKIRKLELSSQERQQIFAILRDLMPVVELLGGIAAAQKMYRSGLFGAGFSAWLEGQGLELALAGIIGLQTLNQNKGAVEAVGTAIGPAAAGSIIKALLPG